MHRLARLEGATRIAPAWLAVIAIASFPLNACESAREIPPPPDPDTARECDSPGGADGGSPMDGGARACAVGQICLQGRCYASCEDDGDCGPREMCAPSGACLRATRDAGPRPDSGPPDPCATLTCTGGQICDAITASCVDCTEATVDAPTGTPGGCSAFLPICDIANTQCVALAPAQCSACNANEECNPPGGSFAGTCVLRDTLGVREQVCLMPCADDSTCPMGLECLAVRDLVSGLDVTACVPPIELPCTNWLAAVGARACASDAACAPARAGRAIYPGACDGLPVEEDGGVADEDGGAGGEDGGAEDGGPPPLGTCIQPCGASDDCFAEASGQQCGADGFCRIP